MANSSCLFLAVIFGILALSAANVAQEMHKLAIANNELALNLYRSFSNTGEGNVFFSPFSISSALAMLFYGTRGETAEELREALGYNKANLEDEQLHALFHHLLTEVLSSNDSDAYVLKSANALFADKAMGLAEDYRHEIQRLYGATVQDVEFAKDGDEIVAKVNQWVNTNTNGKIKKLLDELNRSTVMILLNAVYFKGKWKKQFNPHQTSKKAFYNNGLESGVKNIQMMHVTSRFPYASVFECQALELPYKGENISMLILLPKTKDGLVTLGKSLTEANLSIIRKRLRETKVEVTLPKFKIEFIREVSPDLKSLGAEKIFSPNANFSGMASNKVSVSQVLHKAFVEVNEEGSEAAAVTGVVVNRVRPMPELKISFVANHPFVFAIIDKRSDVVLFLGHVNNL